MNCWSCWLIEHEHVSGHDKTKPPWMERNCRKNIKLAQQTFQTERGKSFFFFSFHPIHLQYVQQYSTQFRLHYIIYKVAGSESSLAAACPITITWRRVFLSFGTKIGKEKWQTQYDNVEKEAKSIMLAQWMKCIRWQQTIQFSKGNQFIKVNNKFTKWGEATIFFTPI